jgi:predicted Rossmann fold nucleotide-binding protein DprA/Smf involved in DNA uptake
MNIDDLNDWQRPAYECVLQLGPVSADQIVRAIALPKKEVVPLLAQLEELGLIHKIDDRWRAI